jgi:methionyl-tRNA synthetase
LSKYQEKLIQHITNNPSFIFPEERRQSILKRLEEPLRDLSISRTDFDWGIPIPEDFPGRVDGQKHVMYVWFDALTNYLSGIKYNSEIWPANIHLVGKDILWFHAVIWPCMLMSADISLPKQIVSHGFINDSQKKKMSKYWGNVVQPEALLEKYKSDVIRYYLLREGSFGLDINFNEASLIKRHDSELVANIGNMVQRCFKLCHIHTDDLVPIQPAMELFNIITLQEKVHTSLNNFKLQVVIEDIFSEFRNTNAWLTEKAPWKLKGDEHKEERNQIIRTLLESLVIFAHFLHPVLPTTAQIILDRLGYPLRHISTLNWKNLKPGNRVRTCGEYLFPRIGKTRHAKKQMI